MGAEVVCRSSPQEERPLVSRMHKSTKGASSPLREDSSSKDSKIEKATKGGRLMQLWSCAVELNPVQLHVTILESYFRLCGLEPCVVEIDSDTHVHCWVPSAAPSWPTNVWCGGNQQAPGSQGRQPILLIHGFGASAIWQWMHQIRALGAAGFDVYMPDLVFFGGSWSSSGERSERFQAECMAKLMTALGVSEFHVNGISYGGFVAYRLATMYPNRVKSLVMTNSGLLMTKGEQREMLERWQVSDAAELLLPKDTTGVQRLMDLAYHRPPKPPQWLLKKTLPVLFENMVEEKRELLAHLNRELEEGNVTFPKPEMHTLLVWGRHDAVFPITIAERMKSAFGDGTELVILENASHVSNAEQSEDYNDTIIGFMHRMDRRSLVVNSTQSTLRWLVPFLANLVPLW